MSYQPPPEPNAPGWPPQGQPQGWPPQGGGPQGWPPQGGGPPGWPPQGGPGGGAPPPSGGGPLIPILIVLSVLLVLGLAGGIATFVAFRDSPSDAGESAEEPADAAEEPADAGEAPADAASGGCGAVVQMPDLGGGHIVSTPEDLAANSPDAIYSSRPPTSGSHLAQVAASGIYEVFIDERLTTHNLEHGYVVVIHSPAAPPDVIASLQEWAGTALAGDFPKLIVAPYYADLPDGAAIAFTAWHHRLLCTQFDAAAAEAFLDSSYDANGEAPEQGLPPHDAGQPGVLVPEGEDLLLPPLDDGSVSSD